MFVDTKNLTCRWRWFRGREYLEKAVHAPSPQADLSVVPGRLPGSGGRGPRLLRDDHVGVAVLRGLDAALDLGLQQRLEPNSIENILA